MHHHEYIRRSETLQLVLCQPDTGSLKTAQTQDVGLRCGKYNTDILIYTYNRNQSEELKIVVFRDVDPCSLVDIDRRFRGTNASILREMYSSP
jgi:hypothetical protein